MWNEFRQVGLVGLLALGPLGVANASTVFTGPNVNSPADIVLSVSGVPVSGATMANLGFFVTATFADGTNSGPIQWTTDTGGCASASGCGLASGAAGNGTWTLTESLDTGGVSDFNSPDTSALHPWTLTNTATNLAITSISLTGGNLFAFDRDLVSGGDIGTPGSGGGIDYIFNSESGANSPFTVNVVYSRILELTGPAQPCQNKLGGTAVSGPFAGLTTSTGCGDAWGSMIFTFTTPTNCLTTPSGSGCFAATAGGNAVWSFFQDTDQVAPPAPEPLSMGLTFSGLLAIAAVYRRRRMKQGQSLLTRED